MADNLSGNQFSLFKDIYSYMLGIPSQAYHREMVEIWEVVWN